MTGHKDVVCCGDILNSNTRKHKNTCACIDGITWGRRKLSANRSENKITNEKLHVILNNLNTCLVFLACACDTDHSRCKE